MKSKKEIWKPIPGYEGLYEISNQGRVRSLPHDVLQVSRGGYCWHHYDGKILLLKGHNGYAQITLSKKDKREQCKIHRMVAKVFIPNPNNLPQVNHKNENPLDNRVENLEWCTARQNINHGTRNLRAAAKRGTPVVAEQNGYIFEFPSIREAAHKTGAQEKNIIACCRGRRKVAKGYKWRYRE